MNRLCLLFLFLIPLPAASQWHSIGDLDRFTSSGQGELTVTAGSATVSIRFLTPDVVRVVLAPSGSVAVPAGRIIAGSPVPVPTEVRDAADHVTIASPVLQVEVSKRPVRLAFLDASGTPINSDDPGRGMAWNGSAVRVWKSMPLDEYYLGFGEKAGRLQRRGTAMTMWNSDIPAYGADTDPLYQSIPFFYGFRNGRAYGLFFDNSFWSSFDMGKESRDAFSFGAEGGVLDYYFFAGPKPERIVEQFTALTGRMHLPPLWSLGYQQCRWSYPTEARVREIARGFRDHRIPCDVIYLDIDYMDGYRIFTWNRTNFPDPAGLIASLRRDGFRTAVIVDPGIKADTAYEAFRTGRTGDVFLKNPDGTLFIGKVWPGACAFPDFSQRATRMWWGEHFAGLVKDGVRGWWNDMNEPSVFDVPTKTVDLNVIHRGDGTPMTHAEAHNLYGLQMTQATYEGVRALLPDERPFVLTRASFAGGQHWSAAWTGDNVSSWDHLGMAVSMCLNLSISGQPFVGSDIGGFIGYPGGELFARWLQFGVFTPLMRAHSVINEKNKEPWEFGQEYTAVNRETINLRYRLLPYLYGSMQEASTSGMPVMRPLLFDYPAEGEGIWNGNEFLFGKDLLVAPVLQEGATSRSVYLPQGEWYDYWSGERFQGGRSVIVAAPISVIPVFAKAGAILPTREVVQHTGEAPIDPLTFTVYPGVQQSERTYYEDDGISFGYEKGEFFRRGVNQWNASRTTTITLGAVEGTYRPARNTVLLRFIDAAQPASVEMDGKEIDRSAESVKAQGAPGWNYDDAAHILTVRLAETNARRQVRVTWGGS